MNNFRHVSLVCITYYHPALMNKRLIEQLLPVPANVQLSGVYCIILGPRARFGTRVSGVFNFILLMVDFNGIKFK